MLNTMAIPNLGWLSLYHRFPTWSCRVAAIYQMTISLARHQVPQLLLFIFITMVTMWWLSHISNCNFMQKRQGLWDQEETIHFGLNFHSIDHQIMRFSAQHITAILTTAPAPAISKSVTQHWVKAWTLTSQFCYQRWREPRAHFSLILGAIVTEILSSLLPISNLTLGF